MDTPSADLLAPFAMSFPAAAPESAHWTDRVVKQGHVDYCAAYGHATLTVDGVVSDRCPRCGDSRSAVVKSEPGVRTVTGRVVHLERLRNTRNGNPVFRVTLSCDDAPSGRVTLNTRPDVSLAGRIGNAEFWDVEHTFTLDRNTQIQGLA